MGIPTLTDLLPASVKDLERISTKKKKKGLKFYDSYMNSKYY